jgi:hypothetical protein
MKARINIFLILCFSLSATSLYSQTDSLQTINKKKLRTFIVASSAAYGIALIGLNELWYKNNEKQSFQFFNDNAEWKQVDKLGHFFSGYHFSYGTSKALRSCGLPEKKAALWGSLTGFFVMLPIEVFDGFSEAYGASTGDVLANTAGASLFLAQSILWKEPRIKPKFSFHRTHYAGIRPNVLGEDFAHELFKDYNGQTYWLSVDADKFISFPKWLNIAVGYGAHGMVYARTSPNNEAGYDAYRQYYVGIDFDLTAIKTRSKALKTVLFVLDMIKLPAPTLEFSNKGTRFHAFYF